MKTDSMDRPQPYALRLGGPDSDRFYLDIQRFSGTVAAMLEEYAGDILDARMGMPDHGTATPRSRSEYAVELLSLGVFWCCYASAALASGRSVSVILRRLYRLRRRLVFLKPRIDWIRGQIAGRFLVPKVQRSFSDWPACSRKNYRRFIGWLEASGEFREEALRFRLWETLLFEGDGDLSRGIESAVRAACRFRDEAETVLGRYTAGLSAFLEKRSAWYRNREDQLFCTKEAVEYHLNMVGAEIMNAGFLQVFKEMPGRVVLVPGCMRKHDGEKCRSVQDGLDIRCSACSADCRVHAITRLGNRHGFTTCIVPHSSGFSRWLKRWQGTRMYGVVAVACPLNIVVGGYEMRALDIPSQCVLLDYCGCQGHWNPQGEPTDLNLRRLLEVVSRGRRAE